MRIRTLLAIGLCLVLGLAQGAEEKAPVSNVRVLIDMSGSMKKNDPNNLRVPALRLFTQLLPEGTRSGVWTFGQYVNMLVPKGEVDAKWKAQAYKAAEEINSFGRFTDIGGVLKDATWDWGHPDPGAERSIVLLTDGLVDISKNPQENAAARKEILEKMLPRLKQAGVVINTVALSDQADKAFLNQLSAATGGWSQEVHDAAELERVFLHMFEKSVPTESLPLVGNTVRVDASVRELTLLVFRGEHGKPTRIVWPNGDEISADHAPKSVRWRAEARYDLVTVDHPPTGEWRIDAELDPDNRVMVVTNMRVKATKLPNTLLAGESMPYYVSLLQDGAVIRNPLFLDLVNVNLERYHEGEMQRRLRIEDNGQGEDQQAHDGKFSARVHFDVPAGDYEYHLNIDGGTFRRAGRQLVRVVDGPVAVSAAKVSDGDPAHYALSIVPYAEIIDPETLVIDATVGKEGVGELAVDIPRVGPTEWRLDMNVKRGDQFEIKVKVRAKRLDGSEISRDMGSYALGDGVLGERVELPPPPPVVDPEPEPDHGHGHHGKTAPHEAEHPAPAAEHTPPADHHAEEDDHHVPEADHGGDHHEPAPAEESHHGESGHEAAPAEHGDEASHHAGDGADSHADEGDHGGDEEQPDWLMVILKVVGLNVLLIGLGGFVWWKWFRKPKETEAEDDAADAEGNKNKEEKGDD